MSSMHYQPAHKLLTELEAGRITSESLTKALLERIRQQNSHINAVVTLDEERALSRARESDQQRAAGRATGPLHGLPMTLKDTWEVAGMTTTAGAPALQNHVPEKHADIARRLEEAGAIIIGKTNVPIYATDLQSYNKLFGVTNNPYNTDHSPGGSSGGAAAALAATDRT